MKRIFQLQGQLHEQPQSDEFSVQIGFRQTNKGPGSIGQSQSVAVRFALPFPISPAREMDAS